MAIESTGRPSGRLNNLRSTFQFVRQARISSTRVGLTLVVALVLSACGEGTGGGEPAGALAERFVGTVGPGGRTVRVRGASLTFPPGAVSSVVDVTIEPVSAPDVPGADGGWYRMGPAGLNFEVPVEIVLDGVARTDELIKVVAGVDPADDPVVGIQTLPQSDLGGGQRRAWLEGFSTVGPRRISIAGACREPVSPQITGAGYDRCRDLLTLDWMSNDPVWVEVGYRAGGPEQPVTWQRIFVDQLGGPLRVRPGAYSGSSENPNTFVFRVYGSRTCQNQAVLSPPDSTEILAPLDFEPRPVEALTVQRAGQTVLLTWAWAASEAGGRSPDAFEIQRTPGWPDGSRWVSAEARRFEDREADGRDYAYLVRPTWNQPGCSASTASDWVSARARPVGPPPAGDEVTRTCGRLRLTAYPSFQTIRPQADPCRQTGACPDAQIVMTVEQVEGLPLGPIGVSVLGPSPLTEGGLVTITSSFIDGPTYFGRPTAELSAPGLAVVTATISISAPQDIFDSADSLPATWFVPIGAVDCVLQTWVEVEPS